MYLKYSSLNRSWCSLMPNFTGKIRPPNYLLVWYWVMTQCLPFISGFSSLLFGRKHHWLDVLTEVVPVLIAGTFLPPLWPPQTWYCSEYYEPAVNAATCVTASRHDVVHCCCDHYCGLFAKVETPLHWVAWMWSADKRLLLNIKFTKQVVDSSSFIFSWHLFPMSAISSEMCLFLQMPTSLPWPTETWAAQMCSWEQMVPVPCVTLDLLLLCIRFQGVTSRAAQKTSRCVSEMQPSVEKHWDSVARAPQLKPQSGRIWCIQTTHNHISPNLQAHAEWGTQRYISPEILQGSVNLRDGTYLLQGDVYALALLLWEIWMRCSDLFQGKLA